MVCNTESEMIQDRVPFNAQRLDIYFFGVRDSERGLSVSELGRNCLKYAGIVRVPLS